MFEGYALTKAERAMIDDACRLLYRFTRSHSELDNHAKVEAKGYGNPNDRVPLIAARALIVKWFLYGVNHPDMLLRDTFSLRPAAVYMQGLEAQAQAGTTTGRAPDPLGADDYTTLTRAVTAHETAFDRMMSRDRAALATALEG